LTATVAGANAYDLIVTFPAATAGPAAALAGGVDADGGVDFV